MLKAAVMFQGVVSVCLLILLFSTSATIPFLLTTIALSFSFMAIGYIVLEIRKKKPL